MTLPIQPLCGDNAALPLRGSGVTSGRRRLCLSAAWADPPLSAATRRERRRAICSWSVGYGTLTELEESTIKQQESYKKGKVADNATLVEPRGRRLSSTTTSTSIHASPPVAAAAAAASRRSRTSKLDLLAMPGIKTLVNRRRSSDAHQVQVPLVKRSNGTASGSTSGGTSSGGGLIKPAVSLANLRKCEQQVVTLGLLRSSSSSSSVETSGQPPLQPINRLRSSSPQQSICSRCSSILTLAASTSKYSLNSSTGAFVPVNNTVGYYNNEQPLLLCKVCLVEVPSLDACRIEDCQCSFCAQCMRNYVEFEIAQGAYDISCPDAQCPQKGVLTEEEIKRLAGQDLFDKHKKYRLNREIELDKNRTWCPRAGCETVCNVQHQQQQQQQQCQPQSVHCPNCTTDFCSSCKLEWHKGLTCEQNSKKLAKEGKVDDPGIPFNSDLIKCCPMCNVPIEKDEGCAQMMCKKCKHVFCWYCLASLDDDFLLRHYDKGPCKNKLGHSRASVIWHRTQVIGIFAGFGILLLVASPLLLLVAPCIVCCKCRVCNAGTSNEDELPVDES